MRKTARILLISSLIIVALLVPELVARIFIPAWAPPVSDAPSHFIANPYTGWLHPPSSPVDNRGEQVFSNHLGLRDAELGEKTRPRILFLGDSFTWGWGISNEERYTSRLQKMLPGVQVVNAGITGFGTLQEFFLLKHYKDEIQPDYVVLQIYQNDFSDNLTPDGAYPHPYLDHLNHLALTNYPVAEHTHGLPMRTIMYLGEHTFFYRQLLIRIYYYLAQLNVDIREHQAAPRQEDLAYGMQSALMMLYSYCAEKKLPLIVFASNLEDYQKESVQQASDKFSVPFYNLDAAFAQATQGYEIANDHTGHWNAYGSQLVADTMYPHIVSMISK